MKQSQATSDDHLRTLATEVGQALILRQASVSVAESCTGGWVAKAITDIPGSSDWFGLGLVTYSYAAKQQLLNVPADVLADSGAVCETVVRQMATDVLRLAGADIAVAVSGVAGPGGGSVAKPVGTVWFALAMGERLAPRQTRVVAELCTFDGDRDMVRRASVAHALLMLLEALKPNACKLVGQ